MHIPIEVWLVLTGGAIGGAVSAAYTVIVGPSFGLANRVAVPYSIVLGAGSAMIAIYVITPTDTSQVGKLIGYAILCGFMWKPLLDAGKLIITRQIDARSQIDSASKLTAEVPSTSPEKLPAKASEVAAAAKRLLHTSDAIDNQRFNAEAAGSAIDAISALHAIAYKDPLSATNAIHQIGLAAKATNNNRVVSAATASLRELTDMNGAALTANMALRDFQV